MATTDTGLFCEGCQARADVGPNAICNGCGEQICLHCGCTDSAACPEGCWWIEPGTCSSCFQDLSGHTN